MEDGEWTGNRNGLTLVRLPDSSRCNSLGRNSYRDPNEEYQNQSTPHRSFRGFVVGHVPLVIDVVTTSDRPQNVVARTVCSESQAGHVEGGRAQLVR